MCILMCKISFFERANMKAEKLIRKQFMVSKSQIRKLEKIAKEKKSSAAQMVREAIDAYDPDSLDNISESELLDLVSQRVKEAIAETVTTRKKLNKFFDEVENREELNFPNIKQAMG